MTEVRRQTKQFRTAFFYVVAEERRTRSYCWLHLHHSNPKGEQLARISRHWELSLTLTEPQGGTVCLASSGTFCISIRLHALFLKGCWRGWTVCTHILKHEASCLHPKHPNILENMVQSTTLRCRAKGEAPKHSKEGRMDRGDKSRPYCCCCWEVHGVGYIVHMLLRRPRTFPSCLSSLLSLVFFLVRWGEDHSDDLLDGTVWIPVCLPSTENRIAFQPPDPDARQWHRNLAGI